MNRIIVGAVSALMLASAGLFWWQGRAELERGAPPPELTGAGAGDAPIELPSADPNGRRGAALPGVAKRQMSTDEKRFNRYDKNRDGSISRPEMLTTRVNGFKKLDLNRDNLLTFEEWAVKTANRFKEIDRNGDGIVNREELRAFQAAKDAKSKAKPRCGCGPTETAAGGKNGANGKASPPADLDADDG